VNGQNTLPSAAGVTTWARRAGPRAALGLGSPFGRGCAGPRCVSGRRSAGCAGPRWSPVATGAGRAGPRAPPGLWSPFGARPAEPRALRVSGHRAGPRI